MIPGIPNYTDLDQRAHAKMRHAERLVEARKRFAEGRIAHAHLCLAAAAMFRRDYLIACRNWKTYDMRML